MTKSHVTGRTSWDALRKKLKAEKSKKSKSSKKRKSSEITITAESPTKVKVLKTSEPDNPDLKVDSADYLMSLLKRDLTQTTKSKFDFTHDEDLKLEDIEAAFGHEAAYTHAKKLKSKAAQFYKKKFLDVEEAKKFDQPGFEPESAKEVSEKLTKNVKSVNEITKSLAIDCEMVGVGFKGKKSILARVSICNQFGKEVYDKFILPDEKVVDYRAVFLNLNI